MRSIVCTCLALSLFAGPAAAQGLPPHVLGSGGEVAANATLRLWSTVGEPAAVDPAPTLIGGSTLQGVGFWYLVRGSTGVATEPLPPVSHRNGLHQNQPNPFNPSTTIRFTLAEAGPVRMRLFNVKGELVTDLIDKSLPAGDHTLVFRPTDLSSGVYFYRLEADGFVATRRLLLLK